MYDNDENKENDSFFDNLEVVSNSTQTFKKPPTICKSLERLFAACNDSTINKKKPFQKMPNNDDSKIYLNSEHYLKKQLSKQSKSFLYLRQQTESNNNSTCMHISKQNDSYLNAYKKYNMQIETESQFLSNARQKTQSTHNTINTAQLQQQQQQQQQQSTQRSSYQRLQNHFQSRVSSNIQINLYNQNQNNHSTHHNSNNISNYQVSLVSLLKQRANSKQSNNLAQICKTLHDDTHRLKTSSTHRQSVYQQKQQPRQDSLNMRKSNSVYMNEFRKMFNKYKAKQ